MTHFNIMNQIKFYKRIQYVMQGLPFTGRTLPSLYEICITFEYNCYKREFNCLLSSSSHLYLRILCIK